MPGDENALLPAVYEIRVAGRLTPGWTACFEGMQISVQHDAQGRAVTALSGPFIDQAALFGALTLIRDLGIKLISVNRIESEIIETQKEKS